MPFSIQDFRPLLTDSFCGRQSSQKYIFLQNTELKKINATMADWATPSINCSRWFTCLKRSHFNSLKDQKYPKQLLPMQFGLQVCMKAHIRTEYCKLSRDLVLSHNVLCYTGNLQSTVHWWNILDGERGRVFICVTLKMIRKTCMCQSQH